MGITGGEVTLDSERIFASVGEVPYEWRIDSDAIVWGRNVGEVLGVDDAAILTEGWRYSRLIDPASGPTRHDAVMRATERAKQLAAG